MIKIIFLILFFCITIAIHSQGYVCAIGGGSENYNDWSDAPYRWIVQRANNGKIIIVDVADASNWLPNYFISLGASSAYNKTIPNLSTANLQSTYDELITAKAIFIRGGNQWDYIRFWKGTKVDSAIQFVFNNGGVIAGTSAGAALLGEVDFSAQSGTVYPDEALLNPFYSRMRFEYDFLRLVPNVIFDTHFIERGRHGRLIAMLYNQYYNSGRNLIGVGVDDRTAICISPDGIGEVMGSGAVSIFYKDNLTKYSPYNSGKYTIENLKSHLLTKGWKFDFINKQIVFIPSSAKYVYTNRAWQHPLTDFYLTGNNNISAQLNTNLANFISSVNSNNIAIITHPGFSSSLSSLINYLNSNNLIYSIVYLTSESLNSQSEANKVNQASCFIITGDSLSVLSYLNQNGNLLPDAFQAGITSGKSVLFFGNAGKISGNKYVDNTDIDIYASYRGRMTFNNGINLFGDFIFQPLIFDDSNFYENRTSAVLWGMMRNRSRIGIFLNGIDRIKISSTDKSISGVTTIPFIIVDARYTTFVDSSTYRASGSLSPRQVVAMNNLRFSVTNYSNIKYLIQSGKFDNLTLIKNESETTFSENILNQNYPNPFNSSTTISWYSPISSWLTIKLFDALGREIETIVDGYYEAGNHSKFYIINSTLPSGVYFYQLKIVPPLNSSKNNLVFTKKMLLLK
jgi:cyanophycinase